MAKNPIDIMLDRVEWKQLGPIEKHGDNLPYATHEGVLQLGGDSLRCYQLNTGQRVFDMNDLCRFFGTTEEVFVAMTVGASPVA